MVFAGPTARLSLLTVGVALAVDLGVILLAPCHERVRVFEGPTPGPALHALDSVRLDAALLRRGRRALRVGCNRRVWRREFPRFEFSGLPLLAWSVRNFWHRVIIE